MDADPPNCGSGILIWLKLPVFPHMMDELDIKDEAVPILTPFPLADSELPDTELYAIVLLIALVNFQIHK